MRKKQPSKLEMAILSLLWERGPLTVRDVMENLPDAKERAYTSVLSILQVMERKKQVGHTRKGITYLYHAIVPQEQTLGHVLGEMVRNVFHGSHAAVVQQLLAENKVSDAELHEMEKLIGDLRKQRKAQGEKK